MNKDNQSNKDRLELEDQERMRQWEEEDEELGGSMTFLEHLRELRERLIYSLIALLIGFIIMLNFSKQIFMVLADTIPGAESVVTEVALNPDGEETGSGFIDSSTATVQVRTNSGVQLMEISPAETLITYIKLAAYASIFIAFPVVFYHIWMFVAPGLYKRERRVFLPLIIGSWIFFILGAMFCYFLVFKFALQFLASFAPEEVVQQWAITQWVSFTIRFILAFGIVFQEPVIILFLASLGLVTSEMLWKFFPYALIGMFALGALLTPPDPISQLMCAFPLLFLYLLSIIVVKFIERKKKAEEEPDIS